MNTVQLELHTLQHTTSNLVNKTVPEFLEGETREGDKMTGACVCVCWRWGDMGRLVDFTSHFLQRGD